MSLREVLVTWTCLLVIATVKASSTDEEAFLIYSTGSAVRKVSLSSHKDEAIVADSLHRYVGVAVSGDPNNFYWSTINVDEKTIMRSRNNSQVPEVIVNAGLVAPEKLAVDWVTGNVYFIDGYKKHIGVCTKDGLHCTVILALGTNTAGGLVLNPKGGEMFWSDYGANSSIWRAGMDGSDAKAILSFGLNGPRDLAIDYANDRLYWVDSKMMIVQSSRLNGTDRRAQEILKGNQVHSLAIFGDKVYWTDWKTKAIKSANAADGLNSRTIVNATGLIYDIDIHHSSLKPALSNPCDSHKLCSDICLLAEGGKISCACKLGSKADLKSHTCKPTGERQHLVVAAGDRIIHYHENVFGTAQIEESLTPINLSRIVYDPNTKRLIADDRFTDSLFHLDPSSSETLRITHVNHNNLGGLGFNYKKNIIRWSVTRPRRISQIGPHAVKENLLVSRNYAFADVPLELLSIPDYDESLVVFESDDGKLRLDFLDPEDPSNKITVVEKLIGPKISLAYDERRGRVYVADEGTGNIESFSSNISTKFVQRELLCSGAEKPVSLAVLDHKVFWTVRDSNVLQSVDVDDEYREITSTILPIENSVGIMDIAAVETAAAEV